MRAHNFRNRARSAFDTQIAFVLVTVLTGPVAGQTRIMPCGDSITDGAWGSSDDTGYRRSLHMQLVGAGHVVEFVGSQTSGLPLDFDRDHEGLRDYYQPLHPAVLRAVARVSAAGAARGSRQ